MDEVKACERLFSFALGSCYVAYLLRRVASRAEVLYMIAVEYASAVP